MKFVISSTTLSNHLNTIGRVIASKNTLPILNCFHFRTAGQSLTITASDKDTTIISHLTLNECDSDVTFTVNAKTIQDAIKEIPEQPLEFYINMESYEMTIVYQNGQYRLMAQSAEEYPLPSLDDEKKISLQINAQLINNGIGRASIAVANDTLRPQLNSICFDIRNSMLAMVASNGSHLALTQTHIGEQPVEGTFLLNTRPASLLRSMLAKEQNDVTMNFADKGAVFSTQDFTMICRLTDGKYPNYRMVIPQNNPNIVTVNRAALISVLRRVMVCANPSSILVKFQLENSTMKISSQDMEYGKSAEETMFCDYSNAPMRIAFKGSTLLELIQNIEADEIKFELSDPSRAGLIMPFKQKENEEVIMLIMPSIFTD